MISGNLSWEHFECDLKVFYSQDQNAPWMTVITMCIHHLNKYILFVLNAFLCLQSVDLFFFTLIVKTTMQKNCNCKLFFFLKKN